MEEATKEAHSVLEKAADDMAHIYDVNRQAAPVYKVGDKVWLNAQNISKEARPYVAGPISN